MSTHLRPLTQAILLPEVLSTSFRERRWAGAALAAGDLVAVQVSFLLGYLVRHSALAWYPADLGPDQLLGIAVGLLFLPLVLFMSGLYPGYGLNAVERLRLRMRATLMVLASLIVWDYLVQHGGWSRGVLLATASIAMVVPLALESVLIRWLTRRGAWGTPVVVLGARRAGEEAVAKLREQVRLGLVPVVRLEEATLGAWLAGNPAQPVRLAVVMTPNFGDPRLGPLVESLPFSQVIVVPEKWGLQSQGVAAVDLGGTLGLEMYRNLLRPSTRWWKRVLDIGLCLPLLILAAPVIGLLALWVKRVSPGPAFYAQARAGQHGSTIRVWKLRTMWLDAELRLAEALAGEAEGEQEWARSFKLRDDPRVLPGVGRLLRRYSLDELPQLWNVLKGEMSLVGPRPFPYYHLEHFETKFVRLREQVRPGITGLWQVTVRGDGDLETQQSLDTYYIRNWSIWMDAHILARTLRAVLRGNGAY
jgi:Undecaprenyl-phosphate galactose phosphotransferase WbaP